MNTQKDPRVAMVVKVMEQTRFERARRMIEVGDLRRKDGRVSMAEEAKAIIDALDKYDASVWDAMLSLTEEEAAKAVVAKAEGGAS